MKDPVLPFVIAAAVAAVILPGLTAYFLPIDIETAGNYVALAIGIVAAGAILFHVTAALWREVKPVIKSYKENSPWK